MHLPRGSDGNAEANRWSYFQCHTLRAECMLNTSNSVTLGLHFVAFLFCLSYTVLQLCCVLIHPCNALLLIAWVLLGYTTA